MQHTAVDSEAEESQISSRRHSLARMIVGVVCLLIVASAVAGFWYWHKHPRALLADGNGVVMPTKPGTKVIYAAMTDPDGTRDDRIELSSVAAKVRQNAAGASFRYYVCESSATVKLQDFITAYPRDFDSWCPRRTEVRKGVVLELNGQHPEQLVVRIGASRPGLVRIDGVDVGYSQGWQSGTQRTGLHVAVKFR